MNASASVWFSEPYLTVLLALLFLLPAILFPRASERFFRAIEGFFSRLAAHKFFAVLSLFLLVATLRVALLGRLLLPNPGIHDEFSYLLLGDTFAHGRLANPVHPLWRSFETFHVLSSPTYASKYPPAQGLVLALGELLGHPWIGVLLSAAVMAAAFVWMLQAWMPARWALLAGILGAARLCVASYWINSYWGGAVAAIGGALVLGAVARGIRKPARSSGILLGLGIATLANSRPYEGLFFCIPVGIFLLSWLFRLAVSLERRRSFSKLVLLPVTALLLCTFSTMAFYNWRVTRNPLLLPTVEFTRLNRRPAIFLWQSPGPPLAYDVPQLDYFYNHSEINRYDRSWPALESVLKQKLQHFSLTLFWPAAWLLLPFTFFLYRDTRLRLVLLAMLATLFAFCLVVWPGPHYLAPAAVAWFAFLVQCVRHLRTMRIFGRPVGAALSRAVFVALLLDVSLLVANRVSDPQGWGGWGNVDRARVQDNLNSTPGKHVVLVRYSPNHDVNEEWVFNSADIDSSKIVWARDLPGDRNQRLLAYYRDRTIWLLQPDSHQLSLLRPPVTSLQSAHRRADARLP